MISSTERSVMEARLYAEGAFGGGVPLLLDYELYGAPIWPRATPRAF